MKIRLLKQSFLWVLVIAMVFCFTPLIMADESTPWDPNGSSSSGTYKGSDAEHKGSAKKSYSAKQPTEDNKVVIEQEFSNWSKGNSPKKPSPASAMNKSSHKHEYNKGSHAESKPVVMEDAGMDIRSQTADGISRGMSIDEAYKEAVALTYPTKKPNRNNQEDINPIMTDDQIIRSLVKEKHKKNKIDLDFDEVKLSDIFMTIGAAAEINVVVDPALATQLLDIHLKQVTIVEAFVLIANTYDLGFKKVENSLYVTAKDKIRAENLASKVIKLRNIPAQDAKTMVEELIESISVSEEINSLIVVGTPDEIVKVQGVIDAIDQPQPQVVLEAKIIEVNKDALKDLGVDWSDQITLNFQEGTRDIDIPDVANPANNDIFRISSIERNPIQFTTAIKMLENQNKAKVLSNPRITTMNDKEAEIFVGDRIPYTVTTVSGGVATTDVRFEEPGIRLKITPSIIDEDFVVIKVEPEVSFIFTFRGPNDEFPHTKTRQAVANVRVKDGMPFVLGGLLNQEDKKNLFKVPMLGDAPLIGNLFSYEKHTAVDTELIITIIPTIVYGE